MKQIKELEKPGLYIHIPFCKQACSYCNFYFSTNQASVNSLSEAICYELSLKQNFWHQRELNSIYFGGGTPSILPKRNLHQIFNAITHNFQFDKDIEITFECNPDDITNENLGLWKSLGINRLSIGVQSFFDKDLKLMNRAHESKNAVNAIEIAQKHGFDNLTIDIIYGIPGQKEEELALNLSYLNKYDIPHFSAYALTVEPKTHLAHQIKSGAISETPDDVFKAHFELIKDFSTKNGYEHYEISNFAKTGNRAIHNSNYWLGKPYIGVGPSAHSYNLKERFWNIANNHLYINKLKTNEIFFEKETLTQADKYNEYIITNIRTIWGLNSNHISKNFPEFETHFLRAVKDQVIENLMLNENNIFRLSNDGQFLCDHISTELMADTE